MKNEITFHKGNQNGGMTIRMRGGRSEMIIKNKNRYVRKPKHKESWL